MAADPFAQRLAKVRDRFVSGLEDKIQETYAVLPGLTGEGAQPVQALGETYHRIHSICGTGPTVGFPQIGRAARNAENAIIAAYRAQRSLTADERAEFEQRLLALRDIAQVELLAARAGHHS